jgi:hypothetical protein
MSLARHVARTEGLENLKGKDQSEDLGVDKRTLKLILRKEGGMV